MTLNAGASQATSTRTSWAYKIWGCYGTQTPTDANTNGVPNYDSLNVVCN
jgi:hypothetical protein